MGRVPKKLATCVWKSNCAWVLDVGLSLGCWRVLEQQRDKIDLS